MSKNLKWQFGNPLEEVEKEVKEITKGKDVKEYLSTLPSELPYNEIQSAKLEIRKLGSLVWTAGYYIYKDPGRKNFEKINVVSSTEPTLELTLHNLLIQL